MVPLSVVIITRNEERNIARCLDSVREIADEVMVMDSFSEDNTREICLSHGARFEQHTFDGYAQQKNRAVAHARNDIILSLDADEALGEELKASVLQVKKNMKADVYLMNRLTNYCGTWIRHGGWYPDRKLRLYDRRKAKWAGDYVHEKLEIKPGSHTAFLKGDLLHYSFYTVEEHRKQALKFAELAASSLFASGKKSSWLKMRYKPFSRFVKGYVFQLGFLDGAAGLRIARISAWASYRRYSQLYKLQHGGPG